MSGGAGVAAVHFVDEVVDGVGHAGYLRGDAGLVGAESLGLPFDRVEGRHDEVELAAVVRHSLDGGLDGRQPGLETRLAAIEAAVKGMPDYGSKFDLIVASLDAIKGQAEALGTDQAGIASKIAGVTDAINDLVDEMNSGNTSAAGHRT